MGWLAGSLMELGVGVVNMLSLVLSWEMGRHVSRLEGWGTMVWVAACAALTLPLSKRMEWARPASWVAAAGAGVWMVVMGMGLPAEAALNGGPVLWIAAGGSLTVGMVLLLLKGGSASRLWIGVGAATVGLVLYQVAVLNVGWPGPSR